MCDAFGSWRRVAGRIDRRLTEAVRTALNSIEAAAGSWRGGFLEGFTLKDSVAFDDWQLLQSEKLLSEYTAALDRLVHMLMERSEAERATAQAIQWCEVDPINEEAHACLMRLYEMRGNRAAALKQYQRCVNQLEEAVGEPPSPRGLNGLYQRILGSSAGAVEPPDGDTRTPEARFRRCPLPKMIAAGQRPITILAVGKTGEGVVDTKLRDPISRAAEQHGGELLEDVGDCFLVAFGCATVRESDPELALRAAFRIRDEAVAEHPRIESCGPRGAYIPVRRRGDTRGRVKIRRHRGRGISRHGSLPRPDSGIGIHLSPRSRRIRVLSHRPSDSRRWCGQGLSGPTAPACAQEGTRAGGGTGQDSLDERRRFASSGRF